MKEATISLESEELEDDDKEEIYQKWQDHVNMTASELQEWSANPCSREASVDPIAVIKRNLRLLQKDKSDWTDGDYEDAERTTSFISRMRGNEGETTANGGAHGCPDDKSISLLNWAHNPFDSLPDGPDEDADLEDVEKVTLSSSVEAIDPVVSDDEELEEFEEGDFVKVKEDAFEEANLDQVKMDENTDGEFEYKRYGYVAEKNTEDFNWVAPDGESGQTIEVGDKPVYLVAMAATNAGAHPFFAEALEPADTEKVLGDAAEDKDPADVEENTSSLATELGFETIVDDGNVEELQVPTDGAEAGDIPTISKNQMGLAPWPESWRESDKPARLIALDAYTSFDPPSFRGCRRSMRGKVASVNRYCAAFKDAIMGTTYWR